MKRSPLLMLFLIVGAFTFLVKLFLNGKTGFAVGLVFVLLGAGITYENIYARRRWKRTTGTITALNFRDERISFAYEVNGVRFSGKSGHDPNYQKVGNQIDIRYDPAKPDISHHVSPTGDLLGWSLIALGFALFALQVLA